MASKPKSPAAAAKPAAKPRSPRKKAAAPAAAPEPTLPKSLLLPEPDPEPAPVAAPVAAKVARPAEVLKLKTLIAQVVEASGGRKKGTREIVEATLAALGTALSQGKHLNLPPLGKAKVGRQKGVAGDDGELIVLKLRRGGAARKRKKDVTEGVAAAED